MRRPAASTIPTVIVGRDAELREVERFLSESGAGEVLLLEGEPGIGKTTVGRAAVETAVAAGYRVLACRPAEAEAGLSFAALTDLLDGVDLALVDELPEPQRHALRVALLQEELRSPAPDPRALGMAVAGVLTSLVSAAPILLAVDDAQWLDRPSADALAFALRRVEHDSLRVLIARRADPGNTTRDRLVDAIPPERVRELRLTGLSLGRPPPSDRPEAGRGAGPPPAAAGRARLGWESLLRARARPCAGRRRDGVDRWGAAGAREPARAGRAAPGRAAGTRPRGRPLRQRDGRAESLVPGLGGRHRCRGRDRAGGARRRPRGTGRPDAVHSSARCVRRLRVHSARAAPPPARGTWPSSSRAPRSVRVTWRSQPRDRWRRSQTRSNRLRSRLGRGARRRRRSS